MAKTINFTFEGTDYTLEYTRASVAALEKQGFNICLLYTSPSPRD